jgi:tetratricopeptide (TPR) repeat protein
VDIAEVASLIHSQERICCLAGAGISMDSPSSCLSGLQAVEFILKELTPDAKTGDQLKRYASPASFPSAQPILRFEHLIVVMQNAVDGMLSFIYQLFDHKQPNGHHYLMAHLVENGHLVLTTNFDMNIEQALSGKIYDYAVAGLDPWDLSLVGKKVGFLGKIHGSLYRHGKKTQQSLQTTIRSILSGSSDQLSDVAGPEAGKAFFREVLSNKLLLVIGYSGFDDFDLVPLIRDTKSEQMVIWIKHTSSSQIAVETFEMLDSRYELAGKFYDKSDHILWETVTRGSRLPSRVIQITGQTSDILQCLFTFRSPVEKSPVVCPTWPVPFNLSIPDRWLATGNIFLQYGDYVQAYHCFVEAAKAFSEEDRLGKHRSHHNAADCALALFDYPAALSHVSYAGQYAKLLDDDYRTAMTLFMRSRILLLMGTPPDYEEALAGFQEVGEFIAEIIKKTEERIDQDKSISNFDVNELKNYRELLAACGYNELKTIAKRFGWGACKIEDFEGLASYCNRYALLKYELFTLMDILYLKKQRNLMEPSAVEAAKKEILKLINLFDLQLRDALIKELSLI